MVRDFDQRRMNVGSVDSQISWRSAVHVVYPCRVHEMLTCGASNIIITDSQVCGFTWITVDRIVHLYEVYFLYRVLLDLKWDTC